MRIPFNLLSTKLRSDWVEVPAHPTLRERGIGRVRLQEIDGDVFDDLYDTVRATDTEVDRLEKAEPRDQKALHAARIAKREARKALMEACVIDHDPETFAAEVPITSQETPLGQELLAQLIERGFGLKEAQTALIEGKAKKPFVKKECAEFYERCQPDHHFANNLIAFIRRFQSCDNPTAEEFWTFTGAAPLAQAKEPPT